jgi:hypothetical protein
MNFIRDMRITIVRGREDFDFLYGRMVTIMLGMNHISALIGES